MALTFQNPMRVGAPTFSLAGEQDQRSFDTFLAWVNTIATEAKPALADLMGMNGRRTYLVLVQNNHELRATGGFISAVGVITLENGEIHEFSFVDSYAFFRKDLEYPAPPPPMQRYMSMQLLLLRDANWSPALATTAQLVQRFYAQETGVLLSGVITVDLRAASLVVDAIGPLQVSGIETPITGENFVEQAIEFWENPIGSDVTLASKQFPEWMSQRKDFIRTLAQVALQRLLNGEASYLKLFWNIQKAFQERSIQVWLAQPMLAQQLSLLEWDGGLYTEPDADFLNLIDTNMGFNKVDAVLQRTLNYSITWPEGPTAPARATAVITYTHPLEIPGYTCTNLPDYGEDYAFLIKRCYYDYVRLYVPVGSKLESVAGVEADSVATQRAENQTQYFAGYFVLPVGQQHTVTFQYRLPPHLTQERYKLIVQRQAGANPLPLTLQINGQTVTTTLTGSKLRWPAR